MKLWCLQFCFFATREVAFVCDVAISEVEKFERVMKKTVREWLGVATVKPCEGLRA